MLSMCHWAERMSSRVLQNMNIYLRKRSIDANGSIIWMKPSSKSCPSLRAESDVSKSQHIAHTHHVMTISHAVSVRCAKCFRKSDIFTCLETDSHRWLMSCPIAPIVYLILSSDGLWITNHTIKRSLSRFYVARSGKTTGRRLYTS